MKKLLLGSMAVALATCPAHSVKAGTPAKASDAMKKVLVETRTYGDVNGWVPDNLVNMYQRYYYNTKGCVIGLAKTMRNANQTTYTDEFIPSSIDKYVVSDAGYTTQKTTWQWGQYDFEDYAWKTSKYSVYDYEYDDAGRLVKEGNASQYTKYTYDDNGNLLTAATYIKSTDALTQQLTYSEYDDNGNPGHISSTGKYDSYVYEETLTYDEAGNKIEALQYKEVDDPESPGDKKRQKKQIEKWTYDNGNLSLYEFSIYDAEGNEVPSSKETYELVDGNANEVVKTLWTYMGGSWMQDMSRPVHYIYADYSGKEESTAMTVEASLDEKLMNTVDLSFALPSLANMRKSKMVIYRDCMPIDTVLTTDILDPKTQKCLYQDKEIQNGTYTYFVQPIFSTKTNPMLPGDEEWEAFYSSNPVDVKVYTELPKVTDLKLSNAEVKVSEGLFEDDETYFATISWKNPENVDKYGFVENGIYVDRAKVAESKFDYETTEYTKQLYRDIQCFIVSKYKYGKAISDTIKVTIDDIKEFKTDGIGQVTAKGVVNTTFNGRMITLGENANVTVFTANGQKVSTLNNGNSLSLENLPAATYVICVEKNGKVSAYKYNIK